MPGMGNDVAFSAQVVPPDAKAEEGRPFCSVLVSGEGSWTSDAPEASGFVWKCPDSCWGRVSDLRISCLKMIGMGEGVPSSAEVVPFCSLLASEAVSRTSGTLEASGFVRKCPVLDLCN